MSFFSRFRLVNCKHSTTLNSYIFVSCLSSRMTMLSVPTRLDDAVILSQVNTVSKQTLFSVMWCNVCVKKTRSSFKLDGDQQKEVKEDLFFSLSLSFLFFSCSLPLSSLPLIKKYMVSRQGSTRVRSPMRGRQLFLTFFFFCSLLDIRVLGTGQQK